MCKKLFFLMSAMLIFSLVSGDVFAAPVVKTFTNGSGIDNNLSQPDNWNPSGVPAANSRILILGDAAGAVGPLINSSLDIGRVGGETGNNVMVGDGGAQTALMTVETGASVVSGPVYVGYTSPGITNFNGGAWGLATNYRNWIIGDKTFNGVLNMNGGTLVTGVFIIGDTGRVNVTGGIIQPYNGMTVRAGARIKIASGTIEQFSAELSPFSIAAGGVIDINEGKLILLSDKAALVQGYVSSGAIVGYGDPANVRWDFNVTTTGKTTVWAEMTSVPTPANTPDPVNGGKYEVVSKQLSWKPGFFSISHDVYFGTDIGLVTDAVKTSSLCVSKNQTAATYSPTPTLQYGETYYWRIDENHATGTLKGNIWSFSTLPQAPTEPGLVACWKMDDPSGAWDSSGNGHHGTLAGNAVIADNGSGMSLTLDGNGDGVNVIGYKGINGNHNRTVTAWVKTSKPTTSIVAWGTDAAAKKWHLQIIAAGNIRQGVSGGYIDSTATVTDDQWHFVASVFENDGTPMISEAKIYIDGAEEVHSATVDRDVNTVGSLDVVIGRWLSQDYFSGSIKDVRIYDRALTATEIGNMFVVPQAWKPSPGNLTPALENHTPTLTWSAGQFALQHDVYFGTNQTDVQNATTTESFGTYKGRQSTTSYGPLGMLAYGKTYYWRIDEINTSNPASPWKGNLWKFTMRTFNNFDDFEDYNDITNPINSLPGRFWGDCVSNTPSGYAYIGKTANSEPAQNTQSLKFAYDNKGVGAWNGYYYSELVQVLDTVENWSWTGSGLRLLSLQVYGNAINGADKLYVALEDQAGHSAVIYHPSATVLTTASWQTWEIPLSSFTGVTLAQVKKVYIGVGTRKNMLEPVDWLTGTVYIDNIRIYPPTCKPDIDKPAADISKNCVVDFADIRIMANNWLKQDVTMIPVTPGTNGLKVRYTFDQSDAADSSGNNNNGTLTSVTAVDDPNGLKGKVMNFEGAGYVSVPAAAFTSISNEITISLWQFGSSVQPIACAIFGGDDGAGKRILNAHVPWSSGAVIFDAGYDTTYDRISKNATADQYKGQWNHWAFTKNTTVGQMKVYLNGQLWNSGTGMTRPMTGVTRFSLGSGLAAAGPNSFYNGMIDDFRIYSRVLSDGEILSLAGFTQNVIVPVDPTVNLKVKGVAGQEIIDYRDFSVLSKIWMQEILWPNF